MTAADPRQGPSDALGQILPTLAAGARGLRDPATYLAAATVVGMTVVPGIAIWYLAAGRLVTRFSWDPWSPAPQPTVGEAGLAVIVTLLVGLLLLVGYIWGWMAIGVRAASLERGIPLDAWQSVLTGARRALVAIGGWLLIALAGIPLLIIYVLTRLMADVVVLSGVSVVLTMLLVVAIFVWWLAILLGGYLTAAFAAADRDVGLLVVLRRAFGLLLGNPAAAVLLLLSVWVVATVLVFALYTPTFFAGSAGFSIVGAMGMGGRTISAAVLGAFIVVFGAVVLFLVPMNFAASALGAFGVRAEPDLTQLRTRGGAARQRTTARPPSDLPPPDPQDRASDDG